MIAAILSDMRKTPATMNRDEKMEVVARLEERGAFLVKRSAEQVAEALDLSRFTVFSYLKEIRRQGGGGSAAGAAATAAATAAPDQAGDAAGAGR
jgi:predicted transcriptional regulator YheO